ncbi:hypothetical protein [Chitinimonas taiwanensis]|uniref:hypothetical protein n=1 Tax=Chitinimonas taiwanensis TaxID=240412 RepID=UPI0035B3FD3A
MNRAERREAKKSAKRAGTGRRRALINRPMLHEIHRVFAPIDALFAELRAGEVSAVQGEAVFQDQDGYHTAAPALEGWVDLWEMLKREYRLQLNLAPLHVLASMLRDGTLLTLDQVDAAYAVINSCRDLYRGMDVYQVKSFVRTQQVKIAMEDAGLIAEGGQHAG